MIHAYAPCTAPPPQDNNGSGGYGPDAFGLAKALNAQIEETSAWDMIVGLMGKAMFWRAREPVSPGYLPRRKLQSSKVNAVSGLGS